MTECLRFTKHFPPNFHRFRPARCFCKQVKEHEKNGEKKRKTKRLIDGFEDVREDGLYNGNKDHLLGSAHLNGHISMHRLHLIQFFLLITG